MEDYLSKLNERQREAVEYLDGPELVIAGAGSGKTRVLTYKIVHLLAKGYEPWRILALTFTNKAANEMRDRIKELVDPATASKLWMGTFHSIFARLLRTYADRLGFSRDFTIYDTSDSKSLIKMIIKDMGLDEKVYKPSTVMNRISNAKNGLIGPEQYQYDRDLREYDRRSKMDRLWEVYKGYAARCHVAKAMDFDDLLYYMNVLLRDNPDVLRHLREFFRYVLVDEYQDTNFAQHLIVQQLTQEHGNVCVVGDDAQSIYSFRGANITNILHLERAYPTLRTVKLEQNYRSTQNIINAAGSLIEKNNEQIRKAVFSRNQEGERIEVVKSYSDYEEAYLVTNRLMQQQMKTLDTFDEFAILYRTNAQSRVLEEALRKRNVPYRIYGGVSFYQRKEVKDALAYFRLAVNHDDDEALRRIINFPLRGIGETTVRKIASAAMDRSCSMWQVICNLAEYGVDLNKGTITKVLAFKTMIDEFGVYSTSGGHDAYEAARTIIEKTGLLTMLIHDRTPESVSKQENLNELLTGIREFVDDKQLEGNIEEIYLSNFLSQASLATDQDKEDSDPLPKVTLMTIHAAKGLEFGNVFVVGVEEELLPSAMSMESASQVEEERRLLYVAITRAKRFCMLSYASSRFRNGMTINAQPSRFLRDIDGKWLQFMSGSDLPTYSTRQARDSYYTQERKPSWPGWHSEPPKPASKQPAAASQSGDFRHFQAHEVEPGMRIEHNRFGLGTILDVDTSQPDARIRVNFDNLNVKTLLLKFALFKIVSNG